MRNASLVHFPLFRENETPEFFGEIYHFYNIMQMKQNISESLILPKISNFVTFPR